MESEKRRGFVAPRLSVMMFLQFFVWGAWYTMVGQYLVKIGMGEAIGWVYTVGPLAAILSPLFLGMVADRYFSSQRVLSVLMLLGGVTMFLAPAVAEHGAETWKATLAELTADGTPAQEAIARKYGSGSLGIFPPIIPDQLPFIGILFLHMLCFMPTLGLTNTIAFRNIENSEKQFPVIRVFGTIGWIAAGAILGYGLRLDETAVPLYTAGGFCILLALYAFTLPDTPPPDKGKKAKVSDLLGLGALALMKQRPFAVFMLASMLICIPLAGYYAIAAVFINEAGFHSAGGVMIWGQISEILFMLLIPVLFARLGVKWMLSIGMLAWVVRYGLFATAAPDGVAWMVFIGILLHGICYDFFFVTGFIYTDKKASAEIRGQAQGLLVLATQGIGLGLGAPIMARIYGDQKAANYSELAGQGQALRAQYVEGGESDEALWEKASDLLLQATEWRTVWLYPAGMAAVILVLFIVFFHDRVRDSEAGS